MYVKMGAADCAQQHARPPSMHPAPALIKKYGNRRLYDTAGSRYVNLDNLAAMVRAGREVRVLDAKTGRDLTRVTLTQIITKMRKASPPDCRWNFCAS